MLSLFGRRGAGYPCDGVSRRDFLRIGALGMTGLTLADLLRLRASGAIPAEASHKSVIMIYLPGGPSHIDRYDLKPDAPVEYRGEFRPIQTNVPGMQICELLPLQARLADKFAIVRGIRTQGNHDPTELLTGIPAAASGQIGNVRRPAFGCVISKLRGTDGPVPPYVSVSDHRLLRSYDDPEEPAYLGAAHRPFSAIGPVMQNLSLNSQVSRACLQERQGLLRSFDNLRQHLDTHDQALQGVASYQKRALEMIASSKVRDALDLGRETLKVRDRYGDAGTDLLRARRLVEAGVTVVSVAARFHQRVEHDPGGWDTHANNFKIMRAKLPLYDRAVSALLSDLCDRGLDRDVAVVIWGEFGREPRVSVDKGACETHKLCDPGRGHWPEAGFALVAGGGLKMGQVVGETDRRAERSKGRPFTASSVLATLYQVLGIDPATTFPDHSGRPMYLLDHREPIQELL